MMTLARHTLHGVLTLVTVAALAWVIARGQWLSLSVLIGLPVAGAFLTLLVRFPALGVYTLLINGFIIGFINRYVPGQFGLLTDGLIVILLTLEFFRRFESRQWPWIRGNRLLLVTYVWCAYCFFELVNPEARSREAWFYAGRSYYIHLLGTIWLGLEVFNTPGHFNRFLKLWLGISVLGALMAIRQLYFFLDPFEQAWLSGEAARTTHIINGQLRAFSFYADAGQFGAAQGHAALAALILALGPFPARQRWLLGIAAALCFYGMVLSGTRGSFFVPVAGLAVYLVLARNVKVLVLGGLLGASFLGVLKYTFIGQDNSQIRRLRSALDPNDPSLLLRLENQAKLRQYLRTRPIGGGIGSAAYWGQRFSPGTFLANTAMDSWYVRIWAEMGIVGLTLHVGMILTWIVAFFRKLWPMPPSRLRSKLMALYCGLVGIAVASYGNQVLGQMPTGLLIYLTISFLYVFTHTPHETAISSQLAAADSPHHR